MNILLQDGGGVIALPTWPEGGGRAEATGTPPAIDDAPARDTDRWARQDFDLRPLVAAMADGDEAALRTFYDATVARVYGLALRITRNHGSAEDVAAEVYLQVWRDASRFDADRGAALAWTLTICRSRAIDHLRRRGPLPWQPDPESMEIEQAGPPGDDPESLLDACERDSRLHAALAALPAVQRQMVALAFFRGLSHQEIADHCAMPLGTVKTHIRKALEQLKGALGETATEGVPR